MNTEAQFRLILKAKRTLARDPQSSPELLEALSRDEADVVRWEVAKNPSTPLHVLEELAYHDDEFVRTGVALNPSAPPHLLEVLAQSAELGVRAAVAANPNTPPSLLEAMLEDDAPLVREGLSRNRNAPVAILVKILLEDPNPFLIALAAENLAQRLDELPEDPKLFRTIWRCLPLDRKTLEAHPIWKRVMGKERRDP